MDEEPGQVLGVKLHVDGVEGDGDTVDRLGAVPGHEDHLVPGVSEHVVAIVIWVMKKLIDGGLLGIRLFFSDKEL